MMSLTSKSARRDAWTDFELQVLYDHVNDIEWFDGASALLTRRTEVAIRAKMSMLRREAGILPQNNGPKAQSRRMNERERAAVGSDKLRRRIEELVAA